MPANAATVVGGDITFQWSAAARATQYHLQVATAADFASTSLVYNAGSTSTSATVTGLSVIGKTYYWQVMATNVLGSSSYSSVWSVVAGANTNIGKPLQVSRYSTSVLTDADADKILADATSVLQTNDGTGDVSCNVTFSRSGNVTVFTTGDGIIDSQEKYNAVIALGGYAKVVKEITWCGKDGINIIGCAPTPGSSLVAVRYISTQEGILWAHEYGHTKGLPHRDTDTNAVMYFEIGDTRRRVNSVECTASRN